MMYLQKSFTVPAAPSKITACEACVYNSGFHEFWCPVMLARIKEIEDKFYVTLVRVDEHF